MYLLAGFAVLTGSLDLALGMKGQKNLGARLTDEGFADPLLNSQFRYLGTMWLGFGAALFLCLSDLPRYVVLFQGLMAMMFLGGLGRLASIFQFGIPMPRAGRNLVIWATAFELIGSPLFIWWQHQVMAQS
tara:strand:- start:538 stop:930 length:393 start_codon:yes stop_codon:yes gene_type:complete